MSRRVYIILKYLCLFGFLISVAQPLPLQSKDMATPRPPVAPKRDKTLEIHGDQRPDPYYWMNDRKDPEVLRYLNQENDYLEKRLRPVESLRATLFKEIKSRIKQDDESVPTYSKGYYYYRRYEKNKDYPVYCRKKKLNAKEQIILDGNQLARGHKFFQIGGFSLAEDQNLLAYGADTRGRRIYTIKFKDLKTGKSLAHSIPNVTSNLVWANDNQNLFYVRQDPQTLRWYQVWRYNLRDKKSFLVFEEKDEQFSVTVSKTKSDKFILIQSEQTLANETWTIPADIADARPRLVEPRRRDHLYSMDHLDGKFYVLSNWKAPNFKLMVTAEQKPAEKYWKEIIPHRKDVFLRSFELFDPYLVIEERENGLVRLRVQNRQGDLKTQKIKFIKFDEAAYDAGFASNIDPGLPYLRYTFESLNTPPSVYEYDFATEQSKLIKREEVIDKKFRPENYSVKRLWAPAKDGRKIPLAIIYKTSLFKPGKMPALIYGYGSYGINMDDGFDSELLSLLDRGFVYAIAHIRGGQELGRWWYEEGRTLKKMNTFTDFIACTEYLAKRGYADPKRLYAQGGSAGGLLMGAVMNLRPDLYHGMIAEVPFVDVLTTMLDESIPLTTGEFDEWGNPKQKKYYQYMRRYSPYDNVTRKNYPNLLVMTGLEDSQVQYWEPAKWVARLREFKTDDNLLILKTNMAAGHGGASARDDQYRELALQYAFLIYLAGLNR